MLAWSSIIKFKLLEYKKQFSNLTKLQVTETKFGISIDYWILWYQPVGTQTELYVWNSHILNNIFNNENSKIFYQHQSTVHPIALVSNYFKMSILVFCFKSGKKIKKILVV
jgi:hypothetical protein